MPFEAVVDGVIDGPEDPGVNMLGQKPIVTQGSDPGSALAEIVKDLLFSIADGGNGGTGSDDDASVHGEQLVLADASDFKKHPPRGMNNCRLLGFVSRSFNRFYIGQDVVDCSDFHGIFLFFAGEGES
jgi:hypothetical protein